MHTIYYIWKYYLYDSYASLWFEFKTYFVYFFFIFYFFFFFCCFFFFFFFFLFFHSKGIKFITFTSWFRWRVGPWQNCTRDCGGGVSWRIVTCVKTFEDGTQQWVRGNFCNSLRPSSRKSCNGHICPTWYAGEWSVVNIHLILFLPYQVNWPKRIGPEDLSGKGCSLWLWHSLDFSLTPFWHFCKWDTTGADPGLFNRRLSISKGVDLDRTITFIYLSIRIDRPEETA